MEWYQSKVILICLPVIIIGLAFLMLVAPPLPADDQEFIRQAQDYREASARLQDEMTASPWNGNSTDLETFGRKEGILADRYLSNLSSLRVVELYDYRQEIIRAIEYQMASADDLISASRAFREGNESHGNTLLESASDRRWSHVSHLDRAEILLRWILLKNRLQYVPTG
jgi:hypothetical protein